LSYGPPGHGDGLDLLETEAKGGFGTSVAFPEVDRDADGSRAGVRSFQYSGQSGRADCSRTGVAAASATS